jgi:ABC-type sugar transport system ATPase subunit
VLKDGVQQVDTPQRLYDHRQYFVAGFIGSPA